MVIPTKQQAYAQTQGTSAIPQFLFLDRDPTSNDINYVLYQGWVNTLTYGIWYLEAFIPLNGVITAQWRAVAPIVVKDVPPASPLTASPDYSFPIGQTWCDNVANDYYVMISHPTDTTGYWIELSAGGKSVESFEVDAHTAPGSDPVVPDSNGVVTVTGGQVAAGTTTNVIRTDSLAANTYTIEVQRSSAQASSTIGANGVSHYNSAQFSVDANGFVTLSGGGQAIDSVHVDAFTAPGTDPVLPTAAGLLNVTGGQVAAGTTTNVIRTDSLAANTYTIEIQRSSAQASTTIGANGVAHFKSTDFTVDSNGFVSSTTSGAFNGIAVQTFTVSGTYTPTSGMKYCQVQIVGGGASGWADAASNAGPSGGAGGYSQKVFTAAQIGASQTVTIGSGGAGVVETNAGNPGTASSFGAFITCNPGLAAATINQGGLGGTASGGDLNVTGGDGGSGGSDAPSTGGASFFGSGGRGSVNSVAPAARAYGSGGGGTIATGTSGSGAGGVCIITEYL